MNFHTCSVALHLRTEISDVVSLDMSNQQNNSCDFISKRPMCCVEEISYMYRNFVACQPGKSIRMHTYITHDVLGKAKIS